MKSKRFFLARDVLSTIAVSFPNKKHKWDQEVEVTMRDRSRQIHWLFTLNRSGLAKARRVAKFWNELVEELEQRIGKR